MSEKLCIYYRFYNHYNFDEFNIFSWYMITVLMTNKKIIRNMAGDLNNRSQHGKLAFNIESLLIPLNIDAFQSSQTLFAKKCILWWFRIDLTFIEVAATYFINEIYHRMYSGNSVVVVLFTWVSERLSQVTPCSRGKCSF